LIAAVLGILISLIAVVGIIRMARFGRFSEAFSFRDILATIRTIGWGSYILSLVFLFIIMLIFGIILAIVIAIPYIGLLVFLFLIPPVIIFDARYLTRLYEHGEMGEDPAGEMGGPIWVLA
jgi:hypothetical protein